MKLYDAIPAIIVRAWRIGRRHGGRAAHAYTTRAVAKLMAADFFAGLKGKLDFEQATRGQEKAH